MSRLCKMRKPKSKYLFMYPERNTNVWSGVAKAISGIGVEVI